MYFETEVLDSPSVDHFKYSIYNKRIPYSWTEKSTASHCPNSPTYASKGQNLQKNIIQLYMVPLRGIMHILYVIYFFGIKATAFTN